VFVPFFSGIFCGWLGEHLAGLVGTAGAGGPTFYRIAFREWQATVVVLIGLIVGALLSLLLRQRMLNEVKTV